MTYVIAEPCIGTKDLSCVEVCPVDCIHPTQDQPGFDDEAQLYIDPEECIDCDACVEACPVDACFAEDQLPDEWQKYMQTNVEYYTRTAGSVPSARRRLPAVRAVGGSGRSAGSGRSRAGAVAGRGGRRGRGSPHPGSTHGAACKTCQIAPTRATEAT